MLVSVFHAQDDEQQPDCPLELYHENIGRFSIKLEYYADMRKIHESMRRRADHVMISPGAR